MYAGNKWTPASGELLFRAVQSSDKIESWVNATESQITKTLGDRRENFSSDQTSPRVQLRGHQYLVGIHRIECIGRTSHSCGVLVMSNLISMAIPVDDPLRHCSAVATWESLPDVERDRLAVCEQ